MKIAMLLHKSVEHDSRVRREARALGATGHQVTVLHLPRVAGHCGKKKSVYGKKATYKEEEGRQKQGKREL